MEFKKSKIYENRTHVKTIKNKIEVQFNKSEH